MRRITGLILLFALIAGGVWLLRQAQQPETAVFEPARSGDESVAPPDVAEETPPQVTPAPAPGTSTAEAPKAGASPAEGSQPQSAPDIAAAPEPAAPEAAPSSPAPPSDPKTGAQSEPPASPHSETATAEPPAAPTPPPASPQSETATAEPSATPTPPPAAEAPATAAPPAPEQSSTQSAPAPSAAPPAGSAPSFTLIRVEPSGETVLAGLAAPKSTVEVLDGAAPVAKAEANERGEWALVLEAPLPPGTHDLAVKMTSPDKSEVMLSDQRVAVSVPEGKGQQPLVVLNAPDAASRVMQLPSEPESPGAAPAAKAPEVAAAPKAEPPADQAPSPPAAAPESKVASAPPKASPETEAPPAAPDTATAPSAPPAAPAPEAAAPETAAPEGEAAAPKEPAPPVAPAPEVATAPPPEAEAPAAPPPEKPSEAPAAAEERPKPSPEVAVAAVEAESNGALYIAGTATGPGKVRVYIDDEFVGEAAPTESGTWLLETKRELAPGEYNIRTDQVEAGSGTVVARAEVPFEREIAVAVLKPTTESSDPGGAEVSGSVAGPMSVIIKRGDNLWRISREMYGHGIRYSTIYQANKDQIRNPDRIYPGQVFILPAGDTAWQN